MSDWTSGYVTDIGYTFGYYTELNPLRVKLAFLNAGLVCPEFGTACELGFGQGVSANIHAAASVTHWHGTDFNPAQAGFAQELSVVSGGHSRLFDDTFAEFAQRADLPEFDYIGLHGIWSWISDENRAVIVDFIRRKLKVGGVFYISYNTMPGWAAFAPIRHLMTEHAQVLGAQGTGIVSRINGALDFTDKLLATNPGYIKANPQVADRIKGLKQQNRAYLAHEYFNSHWQPMHFATLAQWLEPAKVGFACSANYMDYIDAVNLTAEQQELLKEIPDVMFCESVRDFMVNQQFRKDYWVKGGRKLNALEKSEALGSQKILLITPRADVVLKITGSLGEAVLTESIYAPILDALADHKPKTIVQLEQAIKAANITSSQLIQAVIILTAAGHLAAVQDDSVVLKAKKQTDKLNTHLMNKARSGNDITVLASPVTGGGMAVNRFQQLFALALQQGKKKPDEWAAFVWQVISLQGQKIIKKAKTLETAEENMSELTAQAHVFATKQLPILKALQIV